MGKGTAGFLIFVLMAGIQSERSQPLSKSAGPLFVLLTLLVSAAEAGIAEPNLSALPDVEGLWPSHWTAQSSAGVRSSL